MNEETSAGGGAFPAACAWLEVHSALALGLIHPVSISAPPDRRQG